MNDSTPSLSNSARQRIQVERTLRIYTLGVYGQPATVAAAGMLAFGLWLTGGSAWLGLWVAAMFAVLARETRVNFAYFRSDALSRRSPRWEQRLGPAALLFGLLWAALPLLTMPDRPALEAVMVITLAGVMTSTLAALGISGPAFRAYVVPSVLGLTLAYLVRGGVEHLLLGALALLYLFFLIVAQRMVEDRFVEQVLAQMRNDELVAQLRQTDAALNKSLAEHQLLFDLASVGIAEVRDERIVRANAQLLNMLGHDAAALLGESIAILYPVAPGGEELRKLRDSLARGLTIERDVQVRRRDGSLLWVALASRAIDPARADGALIVVFTDITDRREREAAMHRLAHEDALTGLPNRRLLEDRLRHALLRTRRRGGSVALLLIDLDGFKKINDGHGHDAGDHVLAEIGRRLVACVRATDTVSRIGGDEFVVLLDDPVPPDEVDRIAHALVAAVSRPVAYGGHPLQVGASVGISVAPQDSVDAEALMRCADEAMYRAKQSGRGAWRRYADGDPAP